MSPEPNPFPFFTAAPLRKKRPVSRVEPPIFDLTDAAETASCRPCPESLRGSFSNPAMQGSLGSIIWTICYLTVLSGLSAYGIHRYVIIYLFLKNRRRAVVPAGHFEQLPKVTMQLPIFNEVYVVERLLKSVSEIDYPHDLLQIQVLDDSTDDTRQLTATCVADLQSRGFNVELIHRTDRTGFKAGALETGLASADSEFVCILDADFVPNPDLLKKTI